MSHAGTGERVELGYALSSEEHSPADLVRHAKLAEDAGFGFGLISDHIHPWTNRQGHSPFVWGVLGGIAQARSDFREQLVEGRDADDMEDVLTLGPDPDKYLDELREYREAGYTHAYVHQIGPDQEGFLSFAKSELLPRS